MVYRAYFCNQCYQMKESKDQIYKLGRGNDVIKIDRNLNRMIWDDCICNDCVGFYRKRQKYSKHHELNDKQIDKHIHSAYSCEICNKEFDEQNKSHLDHNHDTMFVRGSLCRECNLMLGFAKDDLKILTSAISYLQKYNFIEKR